MKIGNISKKLNRVIASHVLVRSLNKSQKEVSKYHKFASEHSKEVVTSTETGRTTKKTCKCTYIGVINGVAAFEWLITITTGEICLSEESFITDINFNKLIPEENQNDNQIKSRK